MTAEEFERSYAERAGMTVDSLRRRRTVRPCACVARFARDMQARQADLERAAEALREDRDEAIRSAYRSGLPMTQIAAVLGISNQRVSQIVRGG